MTHTVCTRCKRSWIFGGGRTICNTCTKHENIVKELKANVLNDVDFDTIIDLTTSIITNGDSKLSDAEIKEITNKYFKKHQTRKRLDEADILFLQLYRANELINIGEGVDLTYV